MFGFLSSSFGTLEFRKKSTKGSRYVERDDLDVKSKNGVIRDATKPLYRDMKHTNTYESKNSSSMRVKVVMKKEEAIMLLSKRRNGGTLSFQDVATELRKIPVGRVSLVHPCNPQRELMLESIPEEH